MSKEPKYKNWPMPQDVKVEKMGETIPGEKAESGEIDDTREGIERMEAHNKGILGKQTPKKFG